MPELPEVEIFRCNIQPHIEGQIISKVIIRAREMGGHSLKALSRKLKGQKIDHVQRRGKYILLFCSSGNIIIYLGMTGYLRIIDNKSMSTKHDHVDFVFSQGFSLRLNDRRRFGSIIWTKGNPYQYTPLQNLGPEPLSRYFTGSYLFNRSRGRKVSIKQFIMESSVVAGIGNIYASEILFESRINPFIIAGTVSKKRYDRLSEVIKKVLRRSIRIGGTMLDSRKGVEKHGGYNQRIKVYGKTNQPCPICGTPIQQGTAGSRSVYYCKRCQKR